MSQEQSTIEQLRAELMGTLKDLRNRDNPMEPDRARAIAQVAGIIVDSARVEVDYIKAVNGDSSKFLGDTKPRLDQPKEGNGVRVITHRIKG